MQREFIAEIPTLGHLDWVHFANEVSDRGVGRRQLLGETAAAMHPADLGVVAVGFDDVLCIPRNRVQRIIIDLTASDDRHPFIEQADTGPNHASLGLTTFAQEHDIVARKQRIFELGRDGVLVAEHTFEERFPVSNPRNRITTDFFLHRYRGPARCLELSEILSKIHCEPS